MATTTSINPDALPQLIGEYLPVDQWQVHINKVFYGLRGSRLGDYYQTFAGADYRLAHALATDYYDRVKKREQAMGDRQGAIGRASENTSKGPPHSPAPIADNPLIILEWGCGNGNLAACFLSHLKALDKDGLVYPRVHYLLIDNQEAVLAAAVRHPDLAPHRGRVETLCANVQDLGAVKAGTVDLILCNELWNDLPTKLMLRKQSEVEEEFLRPNLNEKKYAEIEDWSGFVKAFETGDIQALRAFPPFLEDIIWEREYRKVEWKDVPYRRTITDFLKQLDEEVLVPVNVGAFATVKEAKRLLGPNAAGFHAFDAGTADVRLLNDPEKPCYSHIGGQYSFMVNVALVEAVAKHQGIRSLTIEPQKEFVGRSLGTNVLSLMDLLATHPEAPSMKPWEQDRLILKTIRALNEVVRSPYERPIEFPLRQDLPAEARAELEEVLASLKRDGVPDTIAYLTEDEVFGAMGDLEPLGYEQEVIREAFQVSPQTVDYQHIQFRPS